jgi:acylphosphatase
MERYEIVFAGHVQGVGFRMTVRQFARDLPITGYVQNLATGEVRVVAEGAREDLDVLVSSVERRMAAYIRGRQIDRRPGTGEFDDFTIRY